MARISPSKVFHFQCDHRLLFGTEIENIRTCKEVSTSAKSYEI